VPIPDGGAGYNEDAVLKGVIGGDVGVSAMPGEDDIIDENAIQTVMEILNCTDTVAREALNFTVGGKFTVFEAGVHTSHTTACFTDVERAIDRILAQAY
jgi:hypothetical protein